MIGLIFGDTNFPIEILRKIKKKRLNYLIIDLSKSKKFKKNKKSFVVSVGQFGKIINILKENKCKKVLFAGKVTKPNFSKLKLDLKGIYYMPRIIKASKLGDAAILKEIIKILSEQKIKTINSLSYNPELTLKKGNYSKVKPNKEDKRDIYVAIKALASLGNYKRVCKEEVSEDNTCCICLAPYKQGEGKRTLGCNHEFHKKCIDKWLTVSKKECPICRKNPFD